MKKIRNIGIWCGWILFLYQLINCIISIVNNSKNLSILNFLLGGIMCVIAYFIQIVNWINIMSGVGNRISLIEGLRGYWLSFLPRYIPGTIWGYASRAEWFYINLNYPRILTLIGSIVEISICVVTAITIVIGMLFIRYYSYPAWIYIILLVFISLMSWVIFKLFAEIISRLELHKWINGLTKLSILSSIRIPLKTWTLSFIINVIQWYIFGTGLWIITIGLSNNFEDEFTQMMITTFSFAFSWLIGFFIVVIPGGLGIREFALEKSLNNFLGIESIFSGLIPVYFRLSMSFAEIVWILIGAVILKLRTGKK